MRGEEGRGVGENGKGEEGEGNNEVNVDRFEAKMATPLSYISVLDDVFFKEICDAPVACHSFKSITSFV